ncbi:polyhydroxyalkanoate depolymerase [Glaciimonas sp. CA11.2]|uniref:polyhydroxyalkanoate depolymerase n=1 Tax=Glaciimonas sp. CA11.2 TaxID=3048601 RepID=UPI002AB36D38|nr:polyhydroxyalkanoate depolymerase [Glaciimonas sp. CA11.2]MDY7546212.1 polyhydroxyalkanoate depolymerase [Glaciimonas sp. CA11.2]MEB0162520.1 polyhydroxyalkanoate depolymerase [Glaciimonas sp. CA11.2]
MKYQVYQAHSDMMAGMRLFTQAAVTAMSHPFLSAAPGVRKLSAAYEMFASTEVTHTRPDFRLNTIHVGEGDSTHDVLVHEEVAHVMPFCTLLHFKKEGVTDQPRVLIVAPMSGHFATLLRETARTMLADHDVYITDWHNARDVPLDAGPFGMSEYALYLIAFLEVMGPGSHMVAICQPCVSALVATAIMAEDGNPAQPRSLTLMAGPIDTRVNPTGVNELATSKPFEWFEKNLISTVPQRHPGGGRRVYPGFLQLSAFMSMNLKRHVNAFKGLYSDLVEGALEKANTTRTFYQEYFAVLDMTEEFYLDTIRDVFQEYALPLGKLECAGRLIKPAAIKRTALLTVEGEHDDICAIGQTMAAHDLCSGIPGYMKSHHMQTGVGHYGVFSGRRWNKEVYPIVREMIHVSQ